MKKIGFMLVVLAAAVIAGNAQMLSKGTMELDINGDFDHKGPAGEQVYTSLGLGYFIMDGLELAAAAAYLHDDYADSYHPAIGVQYNFDLGYKIVPFIGGNLGWGIWDYEDTEDKDGFVYGVEAGLKYFFTDNLALSVSFDYDWATAKLWSEKDGLVDNNWGIRWGLRFFFK